MNTTKLEILKLYINAGWGYDNDISTNVSNMQALYLWVEDTPEDIQDVLHEDG